MANRLNINSVPGLVGIVGPLVVIAGDVAASLSVPGYSPIRDSVSSFALTRLGWLQTICFLAMGLLFVVFAVGLYFNVERAKGFEAGISLFTLCGFVLALIAAFHMDAPGSQRTIDGTIHTIVSYSLGLLFPIAILVLAPSLRSTPHWKGVFLYTLFAGILGFGLIIGAVFADLEGWFGLYERMIILNGLIWVEVVAVRLLRQASRQQVNARS